MFAYARNGSGAIMKAEGGLGMNDSGILAESSLCIS